jgi:hypothetical protein
MRYPTVPAGTLVEHLDDLLDGTVADLSELAVEYGSGPEVDMAAIDMAVAEIRATLETRRASTAPQLDDDQFEGAMGVRLYEALARFPVEILDDPSFWAYLSVGPFWFFVRWREPPAQRQRDGYKDYVDGRVNHACVPLRMYLRAQAVTDGLDSSLAAAVPRGTDFWRSHVIRVRTGAAPELARAVTEQQRDARMSVGPLREYAKRINRRWSNQILHILDKDESRAVAQSERD